MNKNNNDWPAGMKIVNADQAYDIRSQGMIMPPNKYGYIHLAAEVEKAHLFSKPSKHKSDLLNKLKQLSKQLKNDMPQVRRADLFTAFIIPPGTKEGRELIEKSNYNVHVATFDIVILIECPNIESAKMVRNSDAFRKLYDLLDSQSSYLHCITAKNPKRIDEVSKETDGIFLFNYFYAADIKSKGSKGIDILLGVWEYTAGWWTAKANLDNSTPLQPIAGEESQYSLINHCRWDKAIDVFPSIMFRPTMGSFVLKNFTVNNIMAMPILYKLA